MSKVKYDQRCTCRHCAREIRWNGKRWEHVEIGPFDHVAKRARKKAKRYTRRRR